MIFSEAALAQTPESYSCPVESDMKQLLSIFILAFSPSAIAEWAEYSTRSNGDVFFFDNARVEKSGTQISVWIRVRYKTSVMAASSYQSLLRLDCSENSETVLQSTFFTDRDWSKPAMATNTSPKPKKQVEKNSSTEKLMSILCPEY